MKVLSLLVLFWSTFCFAQAFEDLLETKRRDTKFYQLISEIDFNSPQITLEYKVGTTSVGLKILQNGKYVAYWYPKGNISAQPEGQVVTYYLARFLKMNEIVAPSEYYSISGKPIETLIGFLETDKDDQDDEWKQMSINDVLTLARMSLLRGLPVPGSIVYRLKNFEPFELVDWQNNRFNTDHAIAKMIRADHPQPSPVAVLDLPDFERENNEINIATEQDLAEELSQIMILDMLTGQVDRFTGGNLEARFDKSEDNPQIGKLHFLVRDNGSALLAEVAVGDAAFQQYLSIVTRFDRGQIERVQLLYKLLEQSPEDIRQLLRMESDITQMKERTHAVLQHVDAQILKYGEDAVFFKN
jgi:hypothetical protein